MRSLTLNGQVCELEIKEIQCERNLIQKHLIQKIEGAHFLNRSIRPPLLGPHSYRYVV